MATINQPIEWFYNVPTQGAPDTFQYTAKIKYTGSSPQTVTEYWNSSESPIRAAFSAPNPTASPYTTVASFTTGAGYNVKFHATDGTLSDVDKVRAFVPRTVTPGSTTYAGQVQPLMLMVNADVNITESQEIGVLLQGQTGSSTYGFKYWDIYINNQFAYQLLLEGNPGQNVDGTYAVNISGSGDLNIKIYAASNDPNGLDEFILYGAKISYY